MDSMNSSNHSSLSDFDSLVSQDLSQSSLTSSRSSSISSGPTILSSTPIQRKSPAEREEEVRTLFVSGLPIDARPRELFLIFRNCKGYESSLLKNGTKFGRPTTPVGFVSFQSREAADIARKELQGFKMDPSLASALRLDFAKSNTRKFTKVNRQLFPDPRSHGCSNSSAYALRDYGTPPFFPNFIPASQWPPCVNQLFHPCAFAYHPGIMGSLNASFAYQLPGMPVPFHPSMLSSSTSNAALPMCTPPRFQHQGAEVPSDSHRDRFPHESPMAACMAPFDSIPVDLSRIVEGNPGEVQHYEDLAGGYFHIGQLQESADDNCITMFVSNLGKFCTEKDLVSLFCCLPGYLHLRVYSEGRETCVAFVDFMDVPSATFALQKLNGSVISPSEKGGIQIEFVKDKLKRLKHNISRIFPPPAD